jgi:hypothetical protein
LISQSFWRIGRRDLGGCAALVVWLTTSQSRFLKNAQHPISPKAQGRLQKLASDILISQNSYIDTPQSAEKY